jgi:hypothetical protein
MVRRWSAEMLPHSVALADTSRRIPRFGEVGARDDACGEAGDNRTGGRLVPVRGFRGQNVRLRFDQQCAEILAGGGVAGPGR